MSDIIEPNALVVPPVTTGAGRAGCGVLCFPARLHRSLVCGCQRPVAFSASLLAYTGLWFVVASPEPKVELSFDNTYLPSEHAQLIDAVHKNSPAEKAGLRPADRIVAIDGQPIADESFMRNIWLRHQPGDQIRLTIVRPSASSPVF